MLRKAISGFEGMMESEEPDNSVIIVAGPPGGLKSSLAFTALMNHTKSTNSRGVYITLEESGDRHRRNLENMGLETTNLINVMDFGTIRKLNRIQGRVLEDPFKIIDTINKYGAKASNLSCFVLDSLNALYTLCPPLKDREELYFFFEELRKINATTILIAEVSEREGIMKDGGLLGAEMFLCDGLIELGRWEADKNVKRFVQIKKMRGVKHNLSAYSIDIEHGKGVVVLGELMI